MEGGGLSDDIVHATHACCLNCLMKSYWVSSLALTGVYSAIVEEALTNGGQNQGSKQVNAIPWISPMFLEEAGCGQQDVTRLENKHLRAVDLPIHAKEPTQVKHLGSAYLSNPQPYYLFSSRNNYKVVTQSFLKPTTLQHA